MRTIMHLVWEIMQQHYDAGVFRQQHQSRSKSRISKVATYTTMSSKSASLAVRLVPNNSSYASKRDPDEDDEDTLFAELEEEIENSSDAFVRESGLKALKAEMERLEHMQQNQYGKYSEIKDEKEVVHTRATLRCPLLSP
ncbi:hypothetical protein CPB84DRAFT_45111 [Gymnopilus junonius]|uniref:Uncharacterized protein n=1 Tax=Gymnopilus junonius TaxID=109634 RepID=A0A9P5NZP1_GYMJU|nr:hypothetical protein CPB84DRAFT_45111 [Gymnopilus junonius]